ncbi:hypothetical protein LZZ85_26340 [Terrimonas sp. NA20]|uniref:CdiI immunity protein domain-containing protein n=1 Tax=Terrimonas ginsenosidimutans TaxID=2908004 RepID=A0ABS9KZZ0_9BACT|nr:hypothetical protein [Terrimonas ginsenosidimutans]MCG2617848.1 hypothetical protein [Terrimonas ginsenosidimutans]
MIEISFEDIKLFIEQTVGVAVLDIGKESADFVCHYLSHDEYEMAFEALFIEVMKLKSPPLIDLKMANEIAIFLRLNEETVFYPNFWPDFEKFTSEYLTE